MGKQTKEIYKIIIGDLRCSMELNDSNRNCIRDMMEKLDIKNNNKTRIEMINEARECVYTNDKSKW